MYFNTINLDELKIEDLNDQFINIKFRENPLVFETPVMYIPFGLEKEYNNYGIKLQFRRTKNDTVEFYNFINSLEDKLKELLESDDLKSQIKPANGKYDPLLLTKIGRSKENLSINLTHENENLNIYNLKKKCYGSAKLMVDSIFKKNSSFFYKIKIKDLDIKEFCV